MSTILNIFLITACYHFACGTQIKKPNILFLFADDQSYETLGRLGLTEVKTPNLDRLAKGGAFFDRAYNMGSWSGAVCVASRHMLNTGAFIWRAHKTHKTANMEQKEGRYWSKYMSSAGYKTYFTGKWHLPANIEECFDIVQNPRGGMPKTVPSAYQRPQANGEDLWSPYDPKHGGFWEGGKHWSEVTADDAIQFIQSAQKHTEPFFAYIAFNAPHDPRQSPKEYLDRYPLKKISVPKSFLPFYPHNQAMSCPPSLRDENLVPYPRTKEAVKVHRKEYFSIVTHMDDQIGRILKALKKSGQADNTYIFFTADHGLSVGHHGLIGKQNLYEHSTRVPFIITGPGIPKDRVIRDPIYLQDVMPTTLAIADFEKPKQVEFQNLLPLAKGIKVSSKHKEIYGAYLDAQRSITLDNKKLIVYPKAKAYRIYDLTEDPLEINDLVGSPKGDQLAQKLFPRLIRLQNQMEDTLDLKKVFHGLIKES